MRKRSSFCLTKALQWLPVFIKCIDKMKDNTKQDKDIVIPAAPLNIAVSTLATQLCDALNYININYHHIVKGQTETYSENPFVVSLPEGTKKEYTDIDFIKLRQAVKFKLKENHILVHFYQHVNMEQLAKEINNVTQESWFSRFTTWLTAQTEGTSVERVFFVKGIFISDEERDRCLALIDPDTYIYEIMADSIKVIKK